MINNFDLIRQYLDFTNEGDFYFLQIISRRKDNPQLDKAQRVYKTYYITSIEHFDRIKEEIIHFCEYFKARAYIHFTKRNKETIAKKMTAEVVSRYFNNERNFAYLYDTMCGQCAESPKTWIIDVDKIDGYSIEDLICLYTNKLKECKPDDDDKVIAIIPTKNGAHIITKPFNVNQFDFKFDSKLLPDIHKNNPTILYIS